VGLFSSLKSFVKKTVIPRLLPIATGFLTAGPLGAAGGAVAPQFFDPSSLIAGPPRAIKPIIPGTLAARAPGVVSAQAPGGFAAFFRRFLGGVTAQEAIRTPGIAGPGQRVSLFAPRKPSVQPPTTERLIRPVFRSFQPIFSPTGALQNIAGGLIRFPQPAFSPFRGSFAGFGGIFSGRGFFRTGGTAPARAARPRGFGIFAGRGFTGLAPARGLNLFSANRALPARAAITTPQGFARSQRAPTPSARALGVQVQSAPASNRRQRREGAARARRLATIPVSTSTAPVNRFAALTARNVERERQRQGALIGAASTIGSIGLRVARFFR